MINRSIVLAVLFVLSAIVTANAVDPGGSQSSANAAAPHLTEARALIAGNNFDGAVTALEPIVQQRPRDADALSLLGFALRMSGDLPKAEAAYLRALAIAPDHLGANEYLGELYLERGDRDAAVERLQVLEEACGACDEQRELAAAIEAENTSN